MNFTTKRLYMVLLPLALWTTTYSQDPVKETGNIKKVSIDKNTISILTENAFAEVTVFSPSIIRVRIDKQPLKKDLSYAVVTQPEKTRASISNAAREITITTDSIRAVIQKMPFSIQFYTTDGRLINEDEKGLHTSWVGDEVTSYRHMQEGERFIGLGEKTGNLDRKGNGYTNWNTDAFVVKFIGDNF